MARRSRWRAWILVERNGRGRTEDWPSGGRSAWFMTDLRGGGSRRQLLSDDATENAQRLLPVGRRERSPEVFQRQVGRLLRARGGMARARPFRMQSLLVGPVAVACGST